MDKDCHGSYGLEIYKEGSHKYYKKKIKNYLKKFLLDYAKALSNEIDIPLIDYSFIIEDKNYYFLSKCYDEKLVDYDVILKPFEADNLLELINKMKLFCLNYSNGEDIYNRFLKQILFSYLIADPDRTVDNMKLYKKDDLLHLAPYMDLDLMFIEQDDSEIFMDLYYLFPDEMEKEIKHIIETSDGSFTLTRDTVNNDFNKLLIDNDKIFNEFILDSESTGYSLTWDYMLNIIYQELNDKTVFKRISNLNFETLENKYKLNFSSNARLIINILFNRRKQKIDLIYKYNNEEKNKKNR